MVGIVRNVNYGMGMMRTLLTVDRLPGVVVALLSGVALLFLLNPPAAWSPNEARTAALVIFVIALWATNLLPEYITALLFFLLAMLFMLAPAEVLFSGFRTTAFWLILSGLIIGVAISTTGLGVRIAGWTARRLRGGYGTVIASLTGLGVGFGFLMPSAMGRVILLVPIAVAIAEHFGFGRGSNGRRGIVLAMVLGSFIPTFAVLTANVPNLVLAGMSESNYGIVFLYGEYLLLHFPVLGFVKAVVIALLIIRLFPDTLKPSVSTALNTDNLRSRQQYILGALLLVLVALWVSDAVHGISPAWIALGGAIFLMLPGVAIVSQKQFNEKVNYASLLFVAAILGLGSVVAHSGLGGRFAAVVMSELPLDGETPFINYLLISATSMVTGLFTTLPGVPAVMTPITNDLAYATGFSNQSILHMQVVGFSTMLFPYQAPPVVVGMQLAGEQGRDAIKVCVLLAIVTLVVLVPLNYLWWSGLGRLA